LLPVVEVVLPEERAFANIRLTVVPEEVQRAFQERVVVMIVVTVLLDQEAHKMPAVQANQHKSLQHSV
jgi:hypothetical protein